MNFRHIRHQMSTQAAKMYMHSMILSHITYCLPIWTQAGVTSLNPLQSLNKQTVKILDKKPIIYHHCPILQKNSLLSWENVIKYSNLCLLYKIISGLSSPPLHQFINIRTADHRVIIGSQQNQRCSAGGLCHSLQKRCIWSYFFFCSGFY